MRAAIVYALAASAVAAYGQVDPSIPLRVKTPQINAPDDMYRRALELRNQQIQNEIQTEQLRQLKQQNATPSLQRPVEAGVTDGLINGRFWNSVSLSARLSLLVGYSQGLKISIALEPKLGTIMNGAFPWNFQLEEIRASVDSFFVEPLNRPIPVASALMIVTKKANGATVAEIEDETAAQRRACAPTPSK